MVGIGSQMMAPGHCRVGVVIFNPKTLYHHLNFPIVSYRATGRLGHVHPKVKTKLVFSLRLFVIIMHKIVTLTPPARLDKYGVIQSDLGALVVWSIWRDCFEVISPVCPTI